MLGAGGQETAENVQWGVATRLRFGVRPEMVMQRHVRCESLLQLSHAASYWARNRTTPTAASVVVLVLFHTM